MADVSKIVAVGFGSWSTVNSIPTLGFSIGVAVDLPVGGITFTWTTANINIIYVDCIAMGILKTLREVAPEEGTYIVQTSFTDDDGDPIIPDSLTWSLLTRSGTIINSRLDVAITPAATISVVLAGDDLAIISGENLYRRLTLKGVFDSDVVTDSPLTSEAEFRIQPFVGVGS